MQQIPKTGEQRFSSQRVVTALTSLSALTLQASTLRFAAKDSVNRLTEAFLDQLVALCGAHQGALFWTPPGHTFLPAGEQRVLSVLPTLTLLACVHMNAREAQEAFASAVPVPDLSEMSADLPAAMIWQRSLTMTLTAPADRHEAIFSQIAGSTAFLLLVWPADARAAQQEAIQFLPSLANAVDTILFHLFAALYEEDMAATEMFPAELLATVGHEFRGPLTTIQGYATTLQRHDRLLTPEERRDFLQAISEATAHLGTLVDRFLDLAQFETHVRAFLPIPVDIRSLAQESITAAQKSRPHHLLLVPFAPEKESGTDDASGKTMDDAFVVSGDRRLLRAMLDILLENAIIYSAPDSSVEILVEPVDELSTLAELQTSSGPDAHQALILPAHFQEHEPLLAIRVRDHGSGISPEHLALIFHRFYRIDTRLTREVNGLGLGLALCKAIVSLHRGMLRVESTIGEGSTFSLILPRGFLAGTDTKVEV